MNLSLIATFFLGATLGYLACSVAPRIKPETKKWAHYMGHKTFMAFAILSFMLLSYLIKDMHEKLNKIEKLIQPEKQQIITNQDK